MSALMNGRPNRARWTGVVWFPLAWILGMSTVAHAAYEAKMFAITHWTDECSGGSRPSWDNMANAWYDEITSHGVFNKDGQYINGSMSLRRFCDVNSSEPDGCVDGSYVDDADAAIIALHGGDSNNHWRGSMRVKDEINECKVDAAEGAGSDDLFVGDQDLEFLHLSSCHSMDDDNINFVNQSFRDSTSPGSGARLHQMNGFHGVMYINLLYTGDYRDFAEDAHDVPIHAAWLDNMYKYPVGWFQEVCPVSYAIGSSPADATNRLLTERYTNIHSDPSSSGAWAYSFYEGCDSTNESGFNDPND
jgi:hypothetical protein